MLVELGERSPAASLNLSKKNETICHGLTKHGVKKMKYDLTLWLGLKFYILMWIFLILQSLPNSIGGDRRGSLMSDYLPSGPPS